MTESLDRIKLKEKLKEEIAQLIESTEKDLKGVCLTIDRLQKEEGLSLQATQKLAVLYQEAVNRHNEAVKLSEEIKNHLLK